MLILCLFDSYWFSRPQGPRRDSRSNGSFPNVTLPGLQKPKLAPFSTENHKYANDYLSVPELVF